ncbi:MAG TPA: hypothetical protein VFG79_22520, partial [Solirubrobacter sp.]|nr:hypothetical protein [Solirubrobacter sp.]
MFRLNDGTLVRSASDITAHLACAHLEQQRLAIARGEREWPRGGPDAHADLVRRRGDAHERAMFVRLAEEAPGRVVDLSPEFALLDRRELEQAAARTAEAMRAGSVTLIYQPTFFDGRWMGRADFLRMGADGRYEVVDTKLARQVKPAMVHQLALYARLAGASNIAHLILGDGRTETLDLDRFAALHRRVVARVERTRPVATFPEKIAHCDVCDFAGECRARRVAADDLRLVANLRRDQKTRLLDSGI